MIDHKWTPKKDTKIFSQKFDEYKNWQIQTEKFDKITIDEKYCKLLQY